jgi:penicillin-binding protein 1C
VTKRLLLLSCLLLFLAAAGTISRIPAPAFPALEYSFQLLDRNGRILRRMTTDDGYWRLPVKLEQVDPGFIRLLLAYEDQRFMEHSGVDFLALIRASKQLLFQGKIVSGASTLTMQTVRLLQPKPRTLLNKLTEIVQALKLERHTSKQQILQRYLTLAPYGGNLQGIRAATLAYFGKEPNHLNLSEIALLVALPQSPESRRPDRHPQAARKARDFVLNRLFSKNLIRQSDMDLAMQQPIPVQRQATPFHAAHLADRLHRSGLKSTITTTLDKRLQLQLEQLAGQQTDLGTGESLAVLVVSNQTRQILAQLGSGDYLHQSQIDLTRAIRSPGSTLKPFIYGLGFEIQIMHPETRVADTAYRNATYNPKNFSGNYRGTVNLRQALQQSLNIPAVKALQAITPQRLIQRFHDLGITLHLPRGEDGGLSVALGGTGITLENLTALYAAIARQGSYLPLSTRTDRNSSAGQLLSPAAAWYVDDILKDTPAPKGFRRNRNIRYKTGTSYGFRDAWSIGYDDNYTVGVWVGRPDGSAGNERTGGNSAAPLLFQVFELLPKPPDRRISETPEAVITRTWQFLPKSLQWLGTPVQGAGDNHPHILFPVDGSTLALKDNQPLILKAGGGTPPYYWLINGLPLDSHSGQQQQWHPDTPGQVDITLIDDEGDSDAIDVWLKINKGE